MSADLLNVAGACALRNPTAQPAVEAYGAKRSGILNEEGFSSALREIGQWPGYAPTPLHDLPALARRLGLAGLRYKDESTRFGLKSFKALGGAYAVYRQLARTLERHNGGQTVSAAEILGGRWRAQVEKLTVTCATDGNHGRSVAWGAQMFGCRCVIYIHATVSEGRRAAIAHYGAEVVRLAGNYDDSVRHAAQQAREHGWTVVSDTTYDGYRDIPIDVMHGYGVMAAETITQCGAAVPSHVLVQAGVGGLAAAVAASFWLAWGPRRPRLIVVEPMLAACYLHSAQAGHPEPVVGTLDTVMAGLACGEVSPAAWDIVSAAAHAYVAIDDHFALDAVRVFASPLAGDTAIVSGETGAAGLAGLLAAHTDASLRKLLELDESAQVLLVGSEGDTDPGIYQQITGRSADAVRETNRPVAG